MVTDSDPLLQDSNSAEIPPPLDPRIHEAYDRTESALGPPI